MSYIYIFIYINEIFVEVNCWTQNKIKKKVYFLINNFFFVLAYLLLNYPT